MRRRRRSCFWIRISKFFTRCKNKRLDRFMLEEFAGAFKHRHLPPQSHLHTVINLNQGESWTILSYTIWDQRSIMLAVGLGLSSLVLNVKTFPPLQGKSSGIRLLRPEDM
ncbi:uncharacterized protein LOC111800516 isoform X2 [Cucurbita pepo subsp. pepo]|uniref:uncharacterized protein LOC111800516 isoform X2 n=1 Tax=Cucurbita pepo subsp. pepo TaxID=3664 RepID=UPI000C9D58A1|nr:uncharacterized protein LOC111800516 isoform X2 [Cucurbita pepo subsp. pepo]